MLRRSGSTPDVVRAFPVALKSRETKLPTTPTLECVAIFAQLLARHHTLVTKSEPLHSFRFVTSLDDALCATCAPHRPIREKRREPDRWRIWFNRIFGSLSA